MTQHEQREQIVSDMAEEYINKLTKCELTAILNHPETPYSENTILRLMGLFRIQRRCARELTVSAQMVICLRSEMEELRE